MLWLFYFHSHTLRNRGRSFLAVVVYSTATLLVWTIYDFSQQYLTVSSVLVGAVLMVGMLGVVAVLFASTFVPLNLAGPVAVLFVLAMVALVGALLSFLLEVRIAIASLRVGH